ncbi:hypothetical protein [Streptacidiphilus albus]|uniref:hypothetical protein n=1 Tax=Streptacidiphilus albus TaxID=105425 RepID=UPI00054C48BA|nr:hypothetical protein [Streptacidiphilus albus]
MIRNTEPPDPIGHIGPIELTAQSSTPTPTSTYIDESGRTAAERRISAWWHTIPPLRRRTGTALVCLVAATLFVVEVMSIPPSDGSGTTAPQPWPAQVTDIEFAGTTAATTQQADQFTIELTVTDTDTRPVTVLAISQPYAALTTVLLPAPPIALYPQAVQDVALQATVRSCAGLPAMDQLPYVTVTVANAVGVQTQSEVLGPSYAYALHDALLAACDGVLGPGHGAAPPR